MLDGPHSPDVTLSHFHLIVPGNKSLPRNHDESNESLQRSGKGVVQLRGARQLSGQAKTTRRRNSAFSNDDNDDDNNNNIY